MFRRRVSPRRVVVEDHIISFHFVIYLSLSVVVKHQQKTRRKETKKRELVVRVRAPKPSKGGGGGGGVRGWCRSDTTTKKYIYIYNMFLSSIDFGMILV